MHAILRRTGYEPEDDGVLRFSDLELDESAHEVRRGGNAINLTATEFNLLRYFMLNPRHVLSKSQILDHVWHYDFGGDGNVVETYVSYLRKKLEKFGPPLIHTIRLVGYTLRESGGGQRSGLSVAAAAPPRRGRADRHRGARRGGLRHLLGTALLPLQPGRPAAGAAPPVGLRRDGDRDWSHCSSPRAGGLGRDPVDGNSGRPPARLRGRRQRRRRLPTSSASPTSRSSPRRARSSTAWSARPTSARPPTARSCPSPISGFTPSPTGRRSRTSPPAPSIRRPRLPGAAP